ncbi:MAG: glutamate dehydrogenase [Alphaproteobacteria bacterium]|nr:MAG: glutamate dehydrogenase [Alphaproteobacteria bacterium]
MTSRSEQHKEELVGQVVGLAEKRLDRDRVAEVTRFLRAFYANVPPDDIREESPDDLFGAALSLWSFGAQRKPGSTKVRVYNPTTAENGWRSSHTVLEIVNDDMPFLVDSVTAALNGMDLTVYLVIHPVLKLERDAAGRRVETGGKSAQLSESFMQVRLSEQSSPERLEAIRDEIERVLGDVRAAVGDWKAMVAKVGETLAELDRVPPPLPADELEEARAFLRWIADDHYTFLGYREYDFEGDIEADDGGAAAARLVIRPGSGLGILRDENASVFDGLRNFEKLPPEVRHFLRQSRLFIITKSNHRATVHRAVPMDTIGVRRFDENGRIVGERLFVGLLTSVAYSRSPRDIPLLRRKVETCLKRAGFDPGSHDGKALQHILETYPRDELLQISDAELFETAMGVLHLQERQRIALFVRRDPFERFVSCMVYIPRDRYTTELRQRIQSILERAWKGQVTAFYTHMTDAPLGRLHVIVATTPGAIPEVDLAELEERLVEAGRSWTDRLQDALLDTLGEAQGLSALRRYKDAFSSTYRERFSAHAAVFDIGRLEAALQSGTIEMNLYRPAEAAGHELRLKLYNTGDEIPLSDVLPMLEHMGLKVIGELPHTVAPDGRDRPLWIHDFGMVTPDGSEVDLGQVRELFHEAFARVWSGEMEDDGFNRLVLRAGLSWREITMLRACCKYLRQAGIPFSQAYMEQTLAGNAPIARLLVKLFRTRFDPSDRRDADSRSAAVAAEIEAALEAVANLDEDRILRRYLNLILATLRTNFFQVAGGGKAKPYLSLKLDSRRIDELPAPRPMMEIFVYSPRVEAIHLRGGKVARGGIRWSDRREDFRTEVLGLLKAQMVKNAVIVPVGSKGGFVVKRLPAAGGREALMAEVVECYKTMMRGLLDLTDNAVGIGEVAPPRDVVRLDDDDPYLVVAADKGTATFSDTANAVSAEYGFWLDDAFASGGSAGYDHKAMGITARGAWEAVKRHFREIGKNIQDEEFTVIGVGDMSGDVFGNGMLLSRKIRLVAAFNHLHIFVDPDPDPEKSFAERQRLFALPRSSWIDYDPALISPGGGVFERKAKSIKLTPEIKARFGIAADSLTPAELIRVLLQAETDLLWFGGIGTFVKASDETHAEVGDRNNDALRVDGRDIRAKVVGEGANLGVTQRGRIEYALRGGRINTDALDNSAGVDTSDHEVNIKILLNGIVANGDMTRKQRDKLLQSMTDEVAQLVLRHNYQQGQALTVAEAAGWGLLDQQAAFMRALERAGRLERAIEFLPDEEELAERRSRRQGLTRPELAVLLAYAKIALVDELLPSDLPDDPQLVDDLLQYFPQPLRERYAPQIAEHRLRREIIATVVTNSLVNRMGPTFVHAMREKTGRAGPDIARAYAVTRGVFELRKMWSGIQALDTKVPAAAQTEMLTAINRLAERGTTWFLSSGIAPLDIAATMAAYAPGVARLAEDLDSLIGDDDRAAIGTAERRLTEAGVPEALARRVASLELLAPALDIVRMSQAIGVPVDLVGRIYFAVGDRFDLDWLRGVAATVPQDTPWDRLAVTAIVDDLDSHQRDLTTRVLTAEPPAAAAGDGDGAPDGAARMIDAWCAGRGATPAQTAALTAELKKAGSVDLAMLAVANRQLRSLIGG